MSDGSFSQEEIDSLLGCDGTEAPPAEKKPIPWKVTKGPEGPNSFEMKGFVLHGLLENKKTNVKT